MTPPVAPTLASLRQSLAAGEADAAEVVAAARARAAAIGGTLNAFIALTTEGPGDAGPLAGVPIAVKDVFVDGGRAPTMGSRVHPRGLSGTAAVLRSLRAAGASVIGYTNLHEWGIGTTSAVTATGPIRNPWDRSRIAGGSSGGSAAAVAAGIVPAAIGTDAAGSVRIPAACCGVVGVKPTFGAIPLTGDVAAASPINHAGVFARNVNDAASIFEVLAATRVDAVDADSLVVGIPRDFFFDDVQPEIASVVEGVARLLGSALGDARSVAVADAGRSSEVVSQLLLPHMARLVADDLKRRPEMFDPWTLRALQRGAAMETRDVDLRPFRAAWDRAFEVCDVIVVPTLPAMPPRIEQHKVELPSGPAVADLAQYALNAPMNTGGVPALALPCGEIEGLPVSATLVAARGGEDVLFATARIVEELLDGAYRNRVAPDSDA